MTAPPPPPVQVTNSNSQPRRKWVIEEPEDKEKWKFNPALAKSKSIRENISWDLAKGFTSAEEGNGSLGVFFFGWEGDFVVVVKGSTSSLADQFVSDLGRVCKIPLPDMRSVFWMLDAEWSRLERSLTLLNKRKKESEKSHINKMITLPVYSIMEYIPSKTLYHCNPKELFGESALSKEGMQICIGLGKIVSFDVLVNNWDRIPIIWDNSGNLGNVLVNTSLAEPVIGIDNVITSYSPNSFPVKYEEYRKKVQVLLSEVANYKDDQSAPTVRRFREFIKTNLDVDVTEQGSLYFCVGLALGFKTIVDNLSCDIIEKLYQDINQRAVKLLGSMSWGADTQSRYGLGPVDVNFLTSTLTVIKSSSLAIDSKISEWKETFKCYWAFKL